MRKGRYYYTISSKYTEEVGKPLEVFSIVSYEETEEALVAKIVAEASLERGNRPPFFGPLLPIDGDISFTVKLRHSRSWEIKPIVGIATIDNLTVKIRPKEKV